MVSLPMACVDEGIVYVAMSFAETARNQGRRLWHCCLLFFMIIFRHSHTQTHTQTCPQLFGCSAKLNLGPTLSFFRKELGGTREEIRERVLSNPTLLRRVVGVAAAAARAAARAAAFAQYAGGFLCPCCR